MIVNVQIWKSAKRSWNCDNHWGFNLLEEFSRCFEKYSSWLQYVCVIKWQKSWLRQIRISCRSPWMCKARACCYYFSSATVEERSVTNFRSQVSIFLFIFFFIDVKELRTCYFLYRADQSGDCLSVGLRWFPLRVANCKIWSRDLICFLQYL